MSSPAPAPTADAAHDLDAPNVLLLARQDGQWRVGGCHKTALNLLHDLDLYKLGLAHPFGRLFEGAHAVSMDTPYGMVAVDFDTRWVGDRNGYMDLAEIHPYGRKEELMSEPWSLARELERFSIDAWGQVCMIPEVRTSLFQRAFEGGALRQFRAQGQAAVAVETLGVHTAAEALALAQRGRGETESQRRTLMLVDQGFVFQPPGWTVESFDDTDEGLAGLQAALLARADPLGQATPDDSSVA